MPNECEIFKRACFIRLPVMWFSKLAVRPSVHSLLRVQTLPLFRNQSLSLLLCPLYLVYPVKFFFLLPPYPAINPCQCFACSPIHSALEINPLRPTVSLLCFSLLHSERSLLPVSLPEMTLLNMQPEAVSRHKDERAT